MQLFYTPSSHFARKVRILLAALNLPVELIDIGNVADNSAAIFGPNPLMKVPTLVDGELVVFDSDHIAQTIVRQYAPDDQFEVLTTEVEQLNARAVINGVMAAEVELLLAARTGIDIHNLPRFDKIRSAMHAGLAWLEQNSMMFERQNNFLAFHLVCMWDHIVLFKSIPLDYPALAACVSKISAAEHVSASAPN